MPRILYVEDHVDTREAILRLLHQAGYQVETAKDGREALANALGQTPDIILLDLALPELDGVKLIKVLRSYLRFSGVAVVVLTGMAAGTLFEQAKELNPSSILIKSSAGFDQIVTAIRDALAQPPSAHLVGRDGKLFGEMPRPRSG